MVAKRVGAQTASDGWRFKKQGSWVGLIVPLHAVAYGPLIWVYRSIGPA